MPLRHRALALASTPALFVCAGCAIQIEGRTPLYRGTTTEATSDQPQNASSTVLSGRFVPSRGQGAFLGAEIEAALCLDTSQGKPRAPITGAPPPPGPSSGATCPRGLELRNVNILAGFILLPTQSTIAYPGFEASFEAGLGEPAGPQTIAGTWYHLGAGAALALPFKPRDLEPGYVVAGYGLEFVTGLRAGLWAPPAESPAKSPSAAPIENRALTLESTFMLGLRLRAFSDLIGVPGYPRPRRSE
jgi:hypothetical protein